MRVFLMFLCLAVSVKAADVKKGLPPNHPATKRWSEAKEAYSKSVENHKTAYLKLIDAAEKRARAAGDLDSVKLIGIERDAFDKRNVFPQLVRSAAFERDILVAKVFFQKEATQVKAIFLTGKMDSAAEMVDVEFAALVLEKTTPKEANQTKPAIIADGNGRTEWKSKDTNRWVHIKDKQWQEFGGGDGERIWIEQSRTDKMVELKFHKADSWIRLYSDHADVRYGVGAMFGFWGDGKWITPLPASKKK